MAKTLALAISGFLCCSAAEAAGSMCDLTKYVYQDQKGNEAVVRQIYECFGLWNNDTSRLLTPRGKCLTYADIKKIDHFKTSAGTRLIGSRLTQLLYKEKTYLFAEGLIVGVPYYSIDVDEPVKDFRKYKHIGPGEVYQSLTEDVPKFDLIQYSTSLPSELKNLEFVFKRCQ